MTNSFASITLNHSPQSIIRVLRDAEKLPTWNPAFTHVGPVKPDLTYPVTVQKLFKGTLAYSQPNPNTLEVTISIPGLTENSTFTLIPQEAGTKVTHFIRQHGFLSAVIGEHEASLVPKKRLTRLAHTLNAR